MAERSSVGRAHRRKGSRRERRRSGGGDGVREWEWPWEWEWRGAAEEMEEFVSWGDSSGILV